MIETSKKFKMKDLVTLQMHENIKESNVFVIKEALPEERYILYHPICPEIFVIASGAELDQVNPTQKGSIQKCLEFASDYEQHLTPDERADLQALRMVFVVSRRLSNRQKHLLSNLGGTIAAEYCIQDLSIATRLVREYKTLLDDFNARWYSNFQRYFNGQKDVTSKKIRTILFNMAGFILAQLHDTKQYGVHDKKQLS